MALTVMCSNRFELFTPINNKQNFNNKQNDHPIPYYLHLQYKLEHLMARFQFPKQNNNKLQSTDCSNCNSARKSHNQRTISAECNNVSYLLLHPGTLAVIISKEAALRQ